ncbi:hypothetical protein OKA04_09135 [Luteolibacter flavescens]|uniref:Uncharacterized protein n=1 Tax=Luteolibacter flavescens TaxID=1859460 RepID=A0ABT3FMU1_9BACT|nr:hypothetical protein [Luteolibacter flavescens]MCW1884891.1 hypothetical protein [Luteolibacter flavescens]
MTSSFRRTRHAKKSPTIAGVVLAVSLALLTGVMAEAPHPAAITEVTIEELGIPYPQPVLNRMEIAKLQAPEVRKVWEEIMPGVVEIMPGMADDSVTDISSTPYADLYRAGDGTTFCCDQSTMSLWVRRGDDWKCLLQSLAVSKTFGGMPPRLPVRYLGKGFFAFSETTPGEEKELPGDKFPQARAITYLLDSKSGAVIARSESFRYDHNPPVKIPAEWYARIGMEPVPEQKK